VSVRAAAEVGREEEEEEEEEAPHERERSGRARYQRRALHSAEACSFWRGEQTAAPLLVAVEEVVATVEASLAPKETSVKVHIV